MCEIWANLLLPKALKSCPKTNKSPNLVTLVLCYVTLVLCYVTENTQKMVHIFTSNIWPFFWTCYWGAFQPKQWRCLINFVILHFNSITKNKGYLSFHFWGVIIDCIFGAMENIFLMLTLGPESYIERPSKANCGKVPISYYQTNGYICCGTYKCSK